jgi:hypothetical protein
MLAAQDQPDTGIVARFTFEVVESGEIEIHLASMLRPERPRLEIDGDQTAQFAVIEKKIDVEILPADLEMVLVGDEGEAFAKFEQQILHARDQAALNIALLQG